MNPFDVLADPIVERFSALTVEDLHFSPAPKLEVGDVALRTFEAARKLKMAPPKLAAAIVEEVQFGPEVISKQAAGPYVNFKVDRGRFARTIADTVLEQGGRFGANATGQGKKLLIEHTSINPNASPHVGRARNAMIGDSLVRLYRFEGYEVNVHYYVNDMGRQIALLVLHCEDPATLSFDAILDAYVEANERAEQDPEFAAAGYTMLAKMEEGDPETKERFRQVTDLCLKGQLAVLARLGIAYDTFDHESKYVKDERLNGLVATLREKGAAFTDEHERLVVDLEKLGHTRDEGRFFVLKRANGSSMYGYRDLAYTMDKMDAGADLNLWLLGEDHKLYAEQQQRILEAVGVKAPEAIHYAYILLKDGKMSTRQGQVVLLADFLDEAERRAGEKVAEQWGDMDRAEQEAISRKVAIAAVRFAILRVGLNKNVMFDWEASLSFSGDTGPYVQYSCARINSILRKSGGQPAAPGAEFPTDSDAEWMLVTKLAAFPEVVSAAVEQRSCSTIATYALELARTFTTFYHECPVLAADTQALRDARLYLCTAARQTLTNALAILGIEALERM